MHSLLILTSVWWLLIFFHNHLFRFSNFLNLWIKMVLTFDISNTLGIHASSYIYCQVRSHGWRCSQTKITSRATHFGDVFHPIALPKVKLGATIIITGKRNFWNVFGLGTLWKSLLERRILCLEIVRHRRGKILTLLLKIGS
jgi:hypothetical protein